MKHMTGRERMRYFLDYYLVRTLVILAVLLFVFYMGWHYTHLPGERVLHVFVMSDLFDEERKTAAIRDLAKALSVSEDQILLDDGFDVGNDGDMQVSTLLANERLDLIICPREEFVRLAGEGTFADLAELDGGIPEKWDGAVVRAAGYEEQDLSYSEDPFHEAGNGAGEVLPYGIVISKGGVYREMSLTKDEMLCGIAANSRHPQNAVTALMYLMGEGL